MREVKFRVWTGKEMIYYKHDIITPHYYDGLGRFLQEYCAGEIMEGIGLKDKNGKDIYEGDMLRCIGNFPEGNYHSNGASIGDIDFATMNRFPVFWLEKEQFGYEGEYLESSQYWEIIGNKFEPSEI